MHSLFFLQNFSEKLKTPAKCFKFSWNELACLGDPQNLELLQFHKKTAF